MAKRKPSFKKGIKTESKNYRPISLLPLISKVIQKSVHDQTQDCLQRNGCGTFINQLSEKIILCLSWLTDLILNGAENGKHTGMILIDHQKAFDTLGNKIFLDKMKCIGFSDKTIKWFHFQDLYRSCCM